MNRNAFLKFCVALCALPIVKIVKPLIKTPPSLTAKELWNESVASQYITDHIIVDWRSSFNHPETDVMPGLHDAITTGWNESGEEDCPACRQYNADHAQITREGVFTYGNYSVGDQVEVQLAPGQRKFLMSLDCPFEVRLMQGEHCIDTKGISFMEIEETPDI